MKAWHFVGDTLFAPNPAADSAAYIAAIAAQNELLTEMVIAAR